MTYAEAAAALGVNPESVAKRMRRTGWARRLGNDGKPRVAVPVNLLSLPRSVLDNIPDTSKGVPDSSLHSIAEVFEKEQARLRKERDAAQALLDDIRERVGRAEGEASTLRIMLEKERSEIVAERTRADRAEGGLASLKLGFEQQQAELSRIRREMAEAHNRAVIAEQQVVEAIELREGAEAALAKARSWNFINFLFGREGKGRR